jgi:hypothetical protein
MLMFLFNLEPRSTETVLAPQWAFSAAQDLIEDSALRVQGEQFRVLVPAGEVKVILVR